nr:electron transfer flavoprotein subunit alpha/FixB family protein [Desulfosalsimonas propionicica]
MTFKGETKVSAVLIVAEHKEGMPSKATLRTITFGRDASEMLKHKLHLLVIGHNVEKVAEQLKIYGADCIFLVNDPALETYKAETWAYVTSKVAQQCNAAMICTDAGSTGKDFMPRVSARIGAGMASGVIGFDGECFKREMWAGSVVARIRLHTEIQVATVQSTLFEPATPAGNSSEIEPLHLKIPPARTRFIEFRKTESKRPDLPEANVVISGGRGLRNAENFRMLERLADLFKGAVGATRAAVDAQWVPNDLQVGQTGKFVAPEFYMACGISGAMQHVAGIKNSKIIVAINKDENAPIFRVADFGMVADLFEVVPALIAAIENTIE